MPGTADNDDGSTASWWNGLLDQKRKQEQEYAFKFFHRHRVEFCGLTVKDFEPMALLDVYTGGLLSRTATRIICPLSQILNVQKAPNYEHAVNVLASSTINQARDALIAEFRSLPKIVGWDLTEQKARVILQSSIYPDLVYRATGDEVKNAMAMDSGEIS